MRLGSAIAEQLSNIEGSTKLVRIGIMDRYSSGGSYEYFSKDGLDPDNIVETILKISNNNEQY